jgi:hypothetical protein
MSIFVAARKMREQIFNRLDAETAQRKQTWAWNPV